MMIKVKKVYFLQKEKNKYSKLHKTTYNYYFNKNEGIKNTKSYDAKKTKKDLNKDKEKEKEKEKFKY